MIKTCDKHHNFTVVYDSVFEYDCPVCKLLETYDGFDVTQSQLDELETENSDLENTVDGLKEELLEANSRIADLEHAFLKIRKMTGGMG